MKTFNEVYASLNEGRFGATSSDPTIQDYIDLIYAATDPDSEDDMDLDSIMVSAKKVLSAKVYNDLINLANVAHFPRKNNQGRMPNTLEWRADLSKRVTKAGKLNANDVRALKTRIKADHNNRTTKMKTFNEVYTALNEGRFGATSSDPTIQDYIDLIYAATDPDSEDDMDLDSIMVSAKKVLSAKVYNDLINLANVAHFPRKNNQGRMPNTLEWRADLSKRVTKAGKLNANDVRALKTRIKADHR